MRPTAVRNSVLLLALVLGTASAAPAVAETISLKADLQGVSGTNSTATGTLTADYDTSSKKLHWRGVYAGVGTYATGGAIYGPGNAVEAKLRAFDSPFEGTAVLSDKQEADLVGGRWLIFIRTAGFPNGELGGQITRAP
jgi:CHRD domain